MPIIDPSAATAGLARLYHYQSFDPDHLSTVLGGRKIYCSDPSSVNDPWDFQPWFDYRPMLNNPDSIERMLALFRATADAALLNDPIRPIFENRIRWNPEELRKFVESFSRRLAEILCKRRIYCLTPFSNSTLMWSHYALNHTGICLEFNVNNDLFRTARPVTYRSTYPEWTPQGSGDQVMQLVLTKSMDWQYEREFRLIGSPSHPEGAPLKLDGNFLHLPPGALASVIIGCRAKFDAIKIAVEKFAPGLPIKRAERVPNHYKLQIV
jgi:hypothetical protein